MNKCREIHTSFTRFSPYAMLLAAALLFAPLSSQAGLNSFFFGDSLSDTGNMFSLTAGLVPSVVPVTGLPYYQGRASNGPVWVDQLAADSRWPGSPRAVNNVWDTWTLTGYDNLAVFGAYTGVYNLGGTGVANTVDVSSGNLGVYPGLSEQVELFGLLSGGVAPSDAWYSLWAGANDLLFPIESDLAASPHQAAIRAYDNLSTAIGTLEGLGAQDFLLLNLPDLSRIPFALSPDSPSPEYLDQATNAFNILLGGIQFDFPDLDIWLIDINTPFDAILDDPSAFGFEGGLGPCLDIVTFCNVPEEFVVTYDGVHATTQAHALVEELVVSHIPLPPAFFLFGSGIVGLLGVARRRKQGRARVAL